MNKLSSKKTINNIDRSAGARISGWLAKRFSDDHLPDDRLTYEYTGVAGQSFGAFAAEGLTLRLIGEANDYVGKSLSGGRLIVQAPKQAAELYANAPIVATLPALVPLVAKPSSTGGLVNGLPCVTLGPMWSLKVSAIMVVNT